MAPIRPKRSATGMNISGGTIPRSGCIQRINAARERYIREAPLPRFLQRKLREAYPQLSAKDGELVERGLRQFFLACLRSRQFVAMPSQAVDALWHEFILHTQAYKLWYQMELALPEKNFIGAPGADGNCNCNMCPYMALNTLEKLYVSLRDLKPQIELDDDTMAKARIPLERMLEMAGRTVGQGDVGKPKILGD